MKWISDGVGEPRRPWYEREEIERIVAENVSAFSDTSSVGVLDLEAFAEQQCGVSLDQYAVLPHTILGVTVFGASERCRVLINRALSEAADDSAASTATIGRWRATLAHEIGHVLLHRILHLHRHDQVELFPRNHGPLDIVEMRCLRRDVATENATHWREVQANVAMASLLMPAGRFSEAFDRHVVVARQLVNGGARALVSSLAQEFVVSRQATLIRISELGLAASSMRLI